MANDKRGLSKYISLLVSAIFIVVVVLKIVGNIPQAAERIELMRRWMTFPLSLANSGDGGLHDDLPDGWSVTAWSGATQRYRLISGGAVSGIRYVLIERTNQPGVAALIQDIVVKPSHTLVISVSAKGQGGAVQVWFRSQKGEWRTDAPGSWLSIPATEDWHAYQLQVTVPADSQTMRLLLRASKTTAFDATAARYIGTDPEKTSNLIANPDFEQDGNDEDPLVWWQTNVQVSNSLPDASGLLLSYQNVADMLAGRFDLIRQRAHKLGVNCSNTPEMTGWLLSQSDRFEKAGGVAAREKLYQLAAELMPECPQPLAVLAALYESNMAYGPAVDLYHKASELAAGSILQGRYAFDEGLLRLRNTGETAQAISAFKLAEGIDGWQSSNWDEGAASYFMGQAFETEGRLPEAVAAYQRVLACKSCVMQRDAAQLRLEALGMTK